MKTRRVLVLLSAACLAAACGSRTGLLVPEHHEAGGSDAAEDAIEEGDASEDVAEEGDVASEPDVVEEDVFIPPDGPDVCPDAGSTVIYLITTQNVLLSFYPPTASFTTIGTINCPDPIPGSEPFSMAVSRQGVAYVEYSAPTPDGHIFRVSTKTAQCGPTGFVPGNAGFPTNFGMGFSADVSDAGLGSEAGETLYLAGDPGGVGMGNTQLATLDVNTFRTHPIGDVAPFITGAELTGTGSGQLYAFYPTGNIGMSPAAIGQIDKANARLLSSVSLPQIDIMSGWAFGFWGGDFYTFTAPDGADTIVQRYRPSDGTVVTVATLPGLVVDGAGVSTCAPSM
jgi:hypothetical protein